MPAICCSQGTTQNMLEFMDAAQINVDVPAEAAVQAEEPVPEEVFNKKRLADIEADL